MVSGWTASEGSGDRCNRWMHQRIPSPPRLPAPTVSELGAAETATDDEVARAETSGTHEAPCYTSTSGRGHPGTGSRCSCSARTSGRMGRAHAAGTARRARRSATDCDTAARAPRGTRPTWRRRLSRRGPRRTVTPARTGTALTQRDLHEGAGRAGVGFRRGRTPIRAASHDGAGRRGVPSGRLLEHARLWAEVHERCGDDATSTWWRQRARPTAHTLEQMLSEVAAVTAVLHSRSTSARTSVEAHLDGGTRAGQAHLRCAPTSTEQVGRALVPLRTCGRPAFLPSTTPPWTGTPSLRRHIDRLPNASVGLRRSPPARELPPPLIPGTSAPIMTGRRRPSERQPGTSRARCSSCDARASSRRTVARRPCPTTW